MKRAVNARLGKLEQRYPRTPPRHEREGRTWKHLLPFVSEYAESLDENDLQEWEALLWMGGDFASVEEYLEAMNERQLRLLEAFLVKYDQESKGEKRT